MNLYVCANYLNFKTLIMKNLFVIGIILSSLFSCQQDPGYIVTGDLDGLTDGKVYLQQRKSGEYVKVDSAEILDGSFVMEGFVEYPEMYYLMVDGKRGAARFFLENSEITITGHVDTLYQVEVEGSMVHDEYVGYNESLEPFGDEFRELYRLRKEAKEEGNEEMVESYSAKTDSLYEMYTDYQLSFVKANPSSYISPTILRGVSYSMDGNELEEYVLTFDESLDGTAEVISLKERVIVLKSVAIGQPAPDFTQNDPEGNPVSLSSKFGSILLIDFWAAWCGPCRGENPNIVKAYEKYHDKGFDVFGVSLDRDKDAWLEAVEKDNLTWTQVSDLKYWQNDAAKLYGVNSIPGNFLLDKDGIILARNVRGEDLQNKLAEIFD